MSIFELLRNITITSKKGSGRGVSKKPKKNPSKRTTSFRGVLPTTMAHEKPPWFKPDLPIHAEKPAESKEFKDYKDVLLDDDDLSDISDSLEAAQIEDDYGSDEEIDEDRTLMTSITPNDVKSWSWKYEIYNELVKNHNNPRTERFCRPYVVREVDASGTLVPRYGFRFDTKQNPHKRLAELWAIYERGKPLQHCNFKAVLKDDLYKYYLRCFLDVLAKYFYKQDKFTFLCGDIQLFIPGETVAQAVERLKKLPLKPKRN